MPLCDSRIPSCDSQNGTYAYMIGFPSNRTCTTPSSRKTRSAISSASHTRDQSRVRLLTIRTERGLDASHQRLRHQQMESNRAESGQTRQGKQSLFLAFRPRFRSFLGFMQHIGMFVLQSQVTGPSVLCALRFAAEDFRHTPSGPTFILHAFMPTRPGIPRRL
jgi:hypothetical protein